LDWWDNLTTEGGLLQKLEGLSAGLEQYLPSAAGATAGIKLARKIAAGGVDPFGVFPQTGAASSAAPQGVQASGATPYYETGGATGMWPPDNAGYGNGFALTLPGPRRIVPYAGGVIPSGYRVAQRPPRRPTAGYPGGVYLVPRRSMNPLNPRALMRAERRMNAFTTWVKRHFRIASAAPKRRKTVGKKRRR